MTMKDPVVPPLVVAASYWFNYTELNGNGERVRNGNLTANGFNGRLRNCKITNEPIDELGRESDETRIYFEARLNIEGLDIDDVIVGDINRTRFDMLRVTDPDSDRWVGYEGKLTRNKFNAIVKDSAFISISSVDFSPTENGVRKGSYGGFYCANSDVILPYKVEAHPPLHGTFGYATLKVTMLNTSPNQTLVPARLNNEAITFTREHKYSNTFFAVIPPSYYNSIVGAETGHHVSGEVFFDTTKDGTLGPAEIADAIRNRQGHVVSIIPPDELTGLELSGALNTHHGLHNKPKLTLKFDKVNGQTATNRIPKNVDVYLNGVSIQDVKYLLKDSDGTIMYTKDLDMDEYNNLVKSSAEISIVANFDLMAYNKRKRMGTVQELDTHKSNLKSKNVYIHNNKIEVNPLPDDADNETGMAEISFKISGISSSKEFIDVDLNGMQLPFKQSDPTDTKCYSVKVDFPTLVLTTVHS